MKEKDYQTIFNHWVKNVYKHTAAFELKLCKGNSLPFSAVAPHQLEALKAVNDGGLVYKIPDLGVQNPFDCFSFFNAPAFIVIRYKDSFELITVSNFIYFKSHSKKKSITYTEAKRISTLSINI